MDQASRPQQRNDTPNLFGWVVESAGQALHHRARKRVRQMNWETILVVGIAVYALILALVLAFFSGAKKLRGPDDF